MFYNYFIIAFRNIKRNKALSAINIFGLATGIATCLIIMLFVQHELGYDRFHEKADRIVRVIFKGSIQGEKLNEAHVMPPVAQTLLADYPEVQEATRLRQYGIPRVTYKDKSFKEDAFAFADANFFQVFTLPFLQGDPKTALLEPNTIVISQAIARKFFGNEDPIGKVLTFKDFNTSCKVTGVMVNMPYNSHFHIDILASMASLPDAKSSSWGTSNFYTYLVLPEGYHYKNLEAKLPGVVEKYMSPQLQQSFGMNYAEFQQKGNYLGLFLQPLTDIYLHSDFMYDLGPRGNIENLYIFSAIALFMLLIACINFMNLSTAGASKRAREVGIRKVLGSVKGQLVGQFLLESILLTALSLLLAGAMVILALPFFNSITGQSLALDMGFVLKLLPALLLFGLLVGMLAGFYPAFFLSSFKPISVLKGTLTVGRKSISIRSSLVVFQFCISITLMVGTLVVYQQLNYMHTKDLGYNKEGVLVLGETWVLGAKEDVFRKQIMQDPRVIQVSLSGYLPAGPSYNNNFTVSPDSNPSQLLKTLKYDVDDQYIPVMGMQMAAGRNFSPEFATDSSSIILNETAVRALGWQQNALGQSITRSDNDGKKMSYRVIGVVKDFHFRSLHERISPLVMVLSRSSGTMIAKVKTDDVKGLLASLKTQWTALTPDEPFMYSFMDERIENTYVSEQKIGRFLGVFAGLTIVVACLGLFGLATFTAEQRTKEMGIRKVLGASAGNIVALLSKDFLKLVIMANLIAWPLAWWIMDIWLQDFEYGISLSPWTFAWVGLAALLIALLTISVKAIKAALANPVNSLRNE
ncbi:FtsX-like permease family protein [Rhodocytophaga rosea]|uniref:FtsX-like permease family protein n=2 Tax=Rhodocytophaga rosea TaxID=2704465 RepID=A0A6C0GXB0_9BACT|nr:FtsX-like permease family protein [Rhodocytophaga rosea]